MHIGRIVLAAGGLAALTPLAGCNIVKDTECGAYELHCSADSHPAGSAPTGTPQGQRAQRHSDDRQARIADIRKTIERLERDLERLKHQLGRLQESDKP